MNMSPQWNRPSRAGLGLGAALLALWVTPARAQRIPGYEKIAPAVLTSASEGAEAEFIAVLAQQADLSAAAQFKTKLGQGRYVYETLMQTARRTQGQLLAELRARGVEHRAFYLVNAVWIKGDLGVVFDVAAREDVARLDANPVMRQRLPEQDAGLTPDLSFDALVAPPTDAVRAVETGVNYVRAPQVWALGYNGQGVVVGGADTGYRWTHAALKNKYRGWNGSTASHDYNWHDSIHSGGGSCGANSSQPCDDNGHGTHTMGTAVGDDGAANQTGVAPGARWIGCRNMNVGAGTPASYLECMEWFVAPYPVGGTTAQGDPSKAPDVTVNSWGCPSSEGCTTPNILLTGVQNTRAAGIVMEVSAGNSGSGCSTVSDAPSFYDESFTTGALNTGADSVATFSSRGPVTADGSSRIKPDIMAPGTSTRSSYSTSDTAYTSLSGTSMAGPHVAGGVAVLLSAFPALSGNVSALESRLTSSAKPITLASTTCSSAAGAVPNNVYGHGRLDLGCAVPANVSGSTAVCSGSSATLSAALVGSGPWTLTWSDGLVQSGLTSSPATRSVSPTVATTYTLTSVSSTGCNQPGAGSATVSIAPPLSSVSIAVAGSTTIGTPCLGGTATVTEVGGGTSSRQWGFRTVSGGAITNIAGQTGASYVLNCANFPGAGAYFLVERSTPGCGSPLVSNEIPVTVTSGAPPVTVTFTSLGAEDGRTWESTETSNVGGGASAADSTTSALRVGDLTTDRSYRSVLSFDTSSLPDTATITAASLGLVRGTSSGTNPFTILGTCQVDVRTGFFGTAATLANADFEAAATTTAVASLSNPASNGAASTGTLNAAGLLAISKTAKTQFKLFFTTDDNDNNAYDYIGFYGGEATTAANRPTLTITYQP